MRRAKRTLRTRQAWIIVGESQAQVGQASARDLVDQDVAGLDVSVHHAILPNVHKGFAQGNEKAQRFAFVQAPLLAQLESQAGPVDELHGEPPAIAGAPHVNSGHDVWMG